MLVSVRVLSIGQIELFNYLLRIIIIINYLKSYGYVQIIYITMEYLINRLTNVEYLKLFNCVQIND